LLWEQRHQVAFDFCRIGVERQPPPPADAADMGVHDHARLPKRTADDDVRGLAPHAVELQELLHGLRHRAAKPLLQGARHAHDGPGLLPVESGGPDKVLEFAHIGRGEVRRRCVAGKQRRRDPVDLCIGALSREDRRHQQLQWVAVLQRQPGDGVAPAEKSRDPDRA
jgi:hypothetical protein